MSVETMSQVLSNQNGVNTKNLLELKNPVLGTPHKTPETHLFSEDTHGRPSLERRGGGPRAATSGGHQGRIAVAAISVFGRRTE